MMNELPMGLRLSILHRTFKRLLNERVGTLGLTGVQFAVLQELRRLEASKPPEINQRDLERAARLTHPTMTEILKHLEKKGFIRCCTGASDKRSKAISSTEKTHFLAGNLDYMDEDIFRELIRGIPGEDVEVFLNVMDHILKNTRKEQEDNGYK
ncbi:MAG: MarR family transcriptional regulator [Lachnospiraceae bacterium]|nr:MarR family transcriptional regulator [Lachnospiraceae bacterium]